MGRKKKPNTAEIYDLFDQFELLLVRDDKIIIPSSETWQRLKSENKTLFGEMTVKAIYTTALRWLNDRKSNTCIEESEVDEEIENIEPLKSESSADNKIKFNIEILPKIWQVISPVRMNYNRNCDEEDATRTYNVLQQGVWCELLQDEINRRYPNIPCMFSFKTNKVYLRGENYITVDAKCKTCNAHLVGYVEDEPGENDSVFFEFRLFNINLTKHTKKNTKTVNLNKHQARKLYKSKKPAVVIKRKRTDESMKIFEKPIGRQPSLAAIRSGRYRYRLKNKLSYDPIRAIEYVKESRKYARTISSIGLNPFHTIYTSPDQLKIYKEYCKNSYVKIMCDASGGVANKLGEFL